MMFDKNFWIVYYIVVFSLIVIAFVGLALGLNCVIEMVGFVAMMILLFMILASISEGLKDDDP